MEHTTGPAKYLHKKFKKPSTSEITTVQSIEVDPSENVNTSSTDKHVDTTISHVTVCRNNNIISRVASTSPDSVSASNSNRDVNRNNFCSTNVESTSSVIYSESNLRILNRSPNDQVASISTSIASSVPEESRSLSTSYPVSSSASVFNVRNNDRCRREDTGPYIAPKSISLDRSILDTQNRNVHFMSNLLQADTNQSYNISALNTNESDNKTRIFFNGIDCESANEQLSFARQKIAEPRRSIASIDPEAERCAVNVSGADRKNISSEVKSSNSDSIEDERPPIENEPDARKTSLEPSSGGKYVCSYCNLSCSKPSVLQKHIRAHTNERPYPCVSCGFSFKTRSNLYKHCRSRSHANRAKDSSDLNVTKTATETNVPVAKMPERIAPSKSTEYRGMLSETAENKPSERNKNDDDVLPLRTKPYKPKFHKLFLSEQNGDADDTENKEREEQKKKIETTKASFSNELVKQNPDLLKQHINNIIHKNQTILDVKEPNFLKKRFLHQIAFDDSTQKSVYRSVCGNNFNINHDEPLNLTARNRKRCMSETEHTQKSLIKELLLKNLTQEQSYVCQFCKISFKNIENFEIHRKNYCKVGENPTSKDIAFVRSHSVNVASVLTQKYSRNNESPSKFVRTTLPLKSPGPCLGKTSLIDDKHWQVFYENRNPTKLHPVALSQENFKKMYEKNDVFPATSGQTKMNDILMNKSQNGIENDARKRNYEEYPNSYNSTYVSKAQATPFKMFGGEVKITETSGETRSFKIENMNTNEYSPDSPKIINYSMQISENMVIKSSLQSGGTVLQNTPTFEKKISPYTPKLDDNNSLSFQFFDSSKMPKNSFSKDTSPIRKKLYEMDNIPEPATRFDFNIKPQEIMYDQNFIELNQKAAKIFAPNLKQPNLTIPGLPVPNKVFSSPKRHYSDNFDQQVSPSWSSLNSPLFSPAIAKHRHDIGPPTPDVFTSGPKIDQVKLSLPEPYVKSSSNLDIFPSSSTNNQINLPQSFLGGIGINSQNLNISGLPLYDPLNIVVNGKLVRHVPGMPGPESGNSIHFGFVSTPVSPIIPIPKIIRTSPVPRESKLNAGLSYEKFHPNDSDVKNIDSLRVMTPNRNLHDMSRTSPTVSKQLGADSSKTSSITKATEQFNRPRSRSPLIHDESERFAETLVKITEPQKKSLKNFRIFTENSTKTLKNIEDSERVKSEIPLKSPLRIISEHQENTETQKTETSTMPLPSGSDGQEKQPLKFLRPNTLAIKPYMKTHHGLTPTMFNQALISPDTPRVAKKYCQLYLNGNCFSYLGLKSSTKVTYCTLNKTQPFYVVSFGKLSMYSEWRHLEAKSDFVRIDTYDSRQRKRNYSIAKIKIPDLLVDSSYKSVMVEASQKKEESNSRTNSLPGGYESNEEYTYIRGRGRGRYVCDQCGIRCKKPSMLKKHIRTHSDVRPYTCQQCNFSFKTKGNLTKHMKSKAHYKRTSTSNCSSSGNGNDMPASRSGTPTDEDSDTDNDVDNDSDDSTRLQEREAAHCLLSLAQNSSTLPRSDSNTDHTDVSLEANANHSSSDHEANSDQKIHSKSEKSISTESSDSSQKESSMNHNVLENMSSKKPLTYPYCKVHSKITNDHREQKSDILKNDTSSNFNHVILGAKNIELTSQSFDGMKNTRTGSELLTSGNVTTPTKIQLISDKLPNADITIASFQQKFVKYEQERAMNPNKFSEFDLKVQKFMNLNENYQQAKITSPDLFRKRSLLLNENEKLKIESESKRRISPAGIINIDNRQENESGLRKSATILDISENSPPRPNIARKRKLSLDYGENYDFVRKLSNISQPYENKALQKPNSSQPYEIHTRAMDLSVSREYVENRNASAREDSSTALDLSTFTSRRNFVHCDQNAMNIVSTVSEPISSVLIFHESQDYRACVEPSKTNLESHQDVRMNIKRKLLNYKMEKNELTEQSELNLQRPESVITLADNSSLDIDANSSDNSSGVSVNSSVQKSSVSDSDTSAMQTLAEIAMKRVPMENHSKQGQNIENTKLAQSVATEYLKLASKNETQPGVINESSVGSNGSGEAIISDLIVKSEENKSCTICAKNFAKPSQLRLHMNIHYLERPFRCESCSVSFRTKGHLQKHERSASHHNKLSSSPTTSSSEPRPFKCSDCNIAFRIHGHLAKHLRSKMHIMKLECLARVPFGLYAELERANSLLTEINTTDCDMCLDSLKVLARKLFSNDPSKLVQIENSSPLSSNSQEQLLVGSP